MTIDWLKIAGHTSNLFIKIEKAISILINRVLGKTQTPQKP